MAAWYGLPSTVVPEHPVVGEVKRRQTQFIVAKTVIGWST
jgi:hypothetical protein